MTDRTKYIILAVVNGVTKQFEYTVSQKAEAIATYQNIRMRADRVKLFSIDTEDSEIWYDLSMKY